jgi:pyruvate,orthophosphate dikinase
MPLLKLDGTSTEDRTVLGGKAWSVNRMLSLGIPVPPAFVITTDTCNRYYENDRALPEDVVSDLPELVRYIEDGTGRRFGDPARPLLVSVRSGAAQSMPGMMDTILNLGMTDDIQKALAEQGGAEWAADTRRRFVEQYQHVVGESAPEQPWDQLHGAIRAVFDSWQSKRAIAYRKDRGIPDEGGTAVTVQAMGFGNLDDDSGTGVLFSRDPLAGGPEPFGEWLARGQGEDVVSGKHTPLALVALAQRYPELHEQLMTAMRTLEQDSRDVQDIEFTVESGTLWLLQSRVAKRSPEAAVRLAVLFERNGVISRSEALDRVSPEQAAALLRPHIEASVRKSATVLATGKPACPGLVSGVVVTDVDAAMDKADEGVKVILVRPTTDPDDVPAMMEATGLLTELGGSTSHAAVVSRELGVPCIVGCGAGTLMDLDGREVTVDATSGEVFAGILASVASTEDDDPDLATLAGWARAEANAGEATPLPDLLRGRSV